MDLLQEIKTRIESLAGAACESGIKAAVRHIEVAERYLARSRKEQEDDLLNDVVYRSNQAFEGMLKEAYSVFPETDASEKSPHQIEQRLLKDDVLSSRVLELFQNYRRNWRNPSTHDHTLFFSNQEALLAIVSVSAFAAVLVDQITEELSYRHEKTEAIEKREALSKFLKGYSKLSFIDQAISLLKAFSADISHAKNYLEKARDSELLGRLSGFITSVDPKLEINREPLYEGHLKPDLVIKKNSESIVIEMKRARFLRGFLDGAIVQISNYLKSASIDYGILYIPPFEANQSMNVRHFDSASGREIIILTPKKSDRKDNDGNA